MIWLLLGYMFLFIHRPFEVWPVLGDVHLERGYAGLLILAWLVAPKKLIANPLQIAYAVFACAVVGCWLASPYMEQGQQVVENWLKIVLFYVILVTTARTERDLKRLVVGFVAIMFVYELHSFKEYLAGRHTFRMGITRLIGVDTSLGDPNSFGASVVFALPWIPALWRSMPSRRMKLFLASYFCLSMLVVLLTGSRGSFMGVVVWLGYEVMRSRYRWAALAACCVLAPVAFVALPESMQNRFTTIIDPDVGPANAKESGEGRVEGLLTGLQLWADNPLFGVGPGAWRPATGSAIESHNLLGQLVGETGAAGLLGFGLILVGFWRNRRWMKRRAKSDPAGPNDFLYQASGAVAVAIWLMLMQGVFGHNLFRHNWLWYGGFVILARHCVRRRSRRTVAPRPVPRTSIRTNPTFMPVQTI